MAATVLPAFAVPDWVLRATIILLAIGFIPALVFSWVFELTPDGLRRESEIDPAQDRSVHTARKLDVAVIVLLLSVGALTLWRPDPRSKAGAESTFEPPAEVIRAEPAPKVDSGPAFAADPAFAAGPSIALLPFLNMSPDADNAYFADGVAEELLNVLARIDGLKVASRTSAFTFKGKDTPIPEIACLLGASALHQTRV